jgi:hypothetical protein
MLWYYRYVKLFRLLNIRARKQCDLILFKLFNYRSYITRKSNYSKFHYRHVMCKGTKTHTPVLMLDIFTMALPAHSGPWPLIQFLNHFYTDGKTPWTSDEPVTRPLPKHRTTQTQNKRIHKPNIHALSGIRTHDPASKRAKTVHALDRAATVTG